MYMSAMIYRLFILFAASIRLYRTDKTGRYGNEEVLKDLEN